MKNAYKLTSLFFGGTMRKVGRKYCIAIAMLFLAKGFLVSAQHMSVISYSMHDGALFIKQAYALSSGDWLGAYDSLTLVKGMVYPLFIALTNFAGIPLFFAQLLLLAFAAHIMVYALIPIIKVTNWRIALFALILFNPANSNESSLDVLRDGIYGSLSLIAVASFIGLLFTPKTKKATMLRWSLLASLSVFAQWNTREEGMLLMPVYLILSLFAIVHLFKNQGDSLDSGFIQSLKKHWKTASIILIPFLFLMLGNLSLGGINYYKYGKWITNEIKSKAFSNAYAALSSIKTKSWEINVPVPKEARLKAYQVSPAFAELAPYLENENNGFLQFSQNDIKDFRGGWFMWALRDATQKAGFHSSLPQSQEFYSQIAHEINASFDKGTLEKADNLSLYFFAWDQRLLGPSLDMLKFTSHFFITFQGYNPFPDVSLGDTRGIAFFQNITNQPAILVPIDKGTTPAMDRVKLKILKQIANAFAWVNPWIAIPALLSYLFITILLFVPKKHPKLFNTWLMLSAFLFIVVTRLALIAYISVSQWFAIGMLYLNIAYPFMIIFEFLTVYITIEYIKHQFTKR